MPAYLSLSCTRTHVTRPRHAYLILPLGCTGKALYAAYVRTYDVRRSGRICRCSRGRGIREAPAPPTRPFRHLRLRPFPRPLSSCRVSEDNGQAKLIQIDSSSLIYCITHFFYIFRYRSFPHGVFRNIGISRDDKNLYGKFFL